ncbi:MAG: NAD(P)H-dependent oxidoreductase [Actinobacteria bacterium]|nr:NAD(P)H-dependent oxidoreductase [Actinomycetota bacterium]
MTDVTIAAFVGSLRKDSFNRMLFNAAVELAPADMTINEVTGWDSWPVLDMDSITTDGYPPAVVAAGETIAQADGVLFVSPEYNYSVPGGMKNAIDWLSRLQPPVFTGKAAAIMGASGGPVGTARMQYHLRQIMVFLDLYPINRPEVMVGRASTAFDPAGTLTNEVTATLVSELLVNLARNSRRLSD